MRLRILIRKILAPLRSISSLGINDHRSGRKKESTHIDRTRQQASGIVSQINNKRLHSLRLQFTQFAVQLLRRRLVELRYPYVPELEVAGQSLIENLCVLDAGYLDYLALQYVISGLFARRPINRERHFLTGLSSQKFDRILETHLFGGLAVNPQNLVSGQNSGAKPR